MSSFTCEKCGIDNLDSESGYIQGCPHYPPEKDGKYMCEISSSGTLHTDPAYYFNGKWVLSDLDTLFSWKAIN